jgi:hypothetical protein
MVLPPPQRLKHDGKSLSASNAQSWYWLAQQWMHSCKGRLPQLLVCAVDFATGEASADPMIAMKTMNRFDFTECLFLPMAVQISNHSAGQHTERELDVQCRSPLPCISASTFLEPSCPSFY